MKIKRYVEVETPIPNANERCGRLRTVETMAIDDFMHSNAKVLIFTYDTAEEAHRRYTSIFKLVTQSIRFTGLRLSSSKNQIYIIKEEE